MDLKEFKGKANLLIWKQTTESAVCKIKIYPLTQLLCPVGTNSFLLKATMQSLVDQWKVGHLCPSPPHDFADIWLFLKWYCNIKTSYHPLQQTHTSEKELQMWAPGFMEDIMCPHPDCDLVTLRLGDWSWGPDLAFSLQPQSRAWGWDTLKIKKLTENQDYPPNPNPHAQSHPQFNL